jgi:hypothetical protein
MFWPRSATCRTTSRNTGRGYRRVTRKKEEYTHDTDAQALYYRYLYPSMFIEADRRETLTILHVALAAAMIVAAFLPHLPALWVRILFFVIGALLWVDAYRALWSATIYRGSTLDAAKHAERKKIPIIHWGSSSGGSNADGDSNGNGSEAADA